MKPHLGERVGMKDWISDSFGGGSKNVMMDRCGV
jgi:hypothetical protein